jgi:hypothetical protein
MRAIHPVEIAQHFDAARQRSDPPVGHGSLPDFIFFYFLYFLLIPR